MAIQDTISKIAKGAGNSDFVKKAKKAGKFINNHLLEDVPDKNKLDSMLYQVFPKRIKQKYAIGTIVGVSAIVGADSIRKMQFRNDIGDVRAGGLSKMTSQTVSPLTTQLQNGEYESGNIMHSLRNSGAEGDIVFALHNMR